MIVRRMTARIAVALFASITFCAAQGTGSSAAQSTTSDTDLNSAIEALRADFRADKTTLITETMNFTDDQSKIFWPIYRKYDTELAKVNDQRVALIKQYAQKWANMGENDAATLLDDSFKFAQSRLDLKEKYAKEFRKAGLTAVNTAKFFQVEHRLDLLVDLKLASELPALWVKTPSKPSN